MTHIAWEVDKNLTIPPDLITRIRIMNDYQRNNQIIGENISKSTLHKIFVHVDYKYEVLS